MVFECVGVYSLNEEIWFDSGLDPRVKKLNAAKENMMILL
jgi:hypothetical protein